MLNPASSCVSTNVDALKMVPARITIESPLPVAARVAERAGGSVANAFVIVPSPVASLPCTGST